VLQLSTAILERRGLGRRKAKARRRAKRAAQAAEAGASAPVVVVNVNGRELGLPADDRQVREFMSALVTER
jgi:hypothetical protein